MNSFILIMILLNWTLSQLLINLSNLKAQEPICEEIILTRYPQLWLT